MKDYNKRYRDYVGKIPGWKIGEPVRGKDAQGNPIWEKNPKPGTTRSFGEIVKDMVVTQNFRPQDVWKAMAPHLPAAGPRREEFKSQMALTIFRNMKGSTQERMRKLQAAIGLQDRYELYRLLRLPTGAD